MAWPKGVPRAMAIDRKAAAAEARADQTSGPTKTAQFMGVDILASRPHWEMQKLPLHRDYAWQHAAGMQDGWEPFAVAEGMIYFKRRTT